MNQYLSKTTLIIVLMSLLTYISCEKDISNSSAARSEVKFADGRQW